MIVFGGNLVNMMILCLFVFEMYMYIGDNFVRIRVLRFICELNVSASCGFLQYYYEPMTGHKFRSLREVERYVNGGVYTPRRRRSRTLKLSYHGYKVRLKVGC